MGDHLRALPPWYVTKPTRSIRPQNDLFCVQWDDKHFIHSISLPCIPPLGWLNRVPAEIVRVQPVNGSCHRR